MKKTEKLKSSLSNKCLVIRHGVENYLIKVKNSLVYLVKLKKSGI